MSYYIFDLDDIVSEKIALAVSDSLVKEALTAIGSQRGKRKKIRTCEAKIKMLLGYCRTQKWGAPICNLKKAFELLEQALGEDTVSLWGLSN